MQKVDEADRLDPAQGLARAFAIHSRQFVGRKHV